MAPDAPTTWCGTCRKYREVMDVYLTDDGRDPSVQWVAMPLECGHNGTDGGHPAPDPRPADAHSQALIDRLVNLQRGPTQPADKAPR